MDKVVVVLVGDWECSATGCWDFVLQKKCMVQCVMVEDGISYPELKSLIEREFAGEMPGVVGRLAYWLPSEMSVFSSAKTPPVSIISNVGVNTFMKVREGSRGLNLFVTFEAPNGTQVGTHVQHVGRSGGRTENEIKRLDGGTPEIVNRDLEEDINGTDDETDQFRGPGQGTGNGRYDTSRVIELNDLDDQEMLAEVEMMEARVREEEESTKKKSKEIIRCQSNWTTADDDS